MNLAYRFKGKILVLDQNLDKAKDILIKEGFRETILQTIKEGQVFGLVKPLNEVYEVHIRGYNDNTLDSEVEISREYLEHASSAKPYYGYVMALLNRYGIPYAIVDVLPPDSIVLSEPKTLTKWKPLALFLAAILGYFLLDWFSRKRRKRK